MVPVGGFLPGYETSWRSGAETASGENRRAPFFVVSAFLISIRVHVWQWYTDFYSFYAISKVRQAERHVHPAPPTKCGLMGTKSTPSALNTSRSANHYVNTPARS